MSGRQLDVARPRAGVAQPGSPARVAPADLPDAPDLVIGVRLPVGLIAQLQLEARAQGSTPSELIGKAVRMLLPERSEVKGAKRRRAPLASAQYQPRS